jgi:peroxiredoxin
MLGALLMRLWLENGRLRRDLAHAHQASALLAPGLPVGTPAPGFSLTDTGGEQITLDALLARGRPVALVFVSPRCGPCEAMLVDLARWQMTLAERITIALLSTGSARENRLMSERHGLESVLVQNGGEVSEAYRAKATPSVVMVSPDGRIASGTRSSRAIVEAVIRSALNTPPEPPLRVITANGDG